MSRLAVVAVVVAVLALGVVTVVFTTSGGAFRLDPGEKRTAAEQDSMLSAGQCAVRPNGTVAGRVVGRLGPTRDHPQGQHQVEAVERRQFFMAEGDEVRLVPCTSLR